MIEAIARRKEWSVGLGWYLCRVDYFFLYFYFCSMFLFMISLY